MKHADLAEGVIFHRPHLIRTVTTALVVGTILFGINHFVVVLAGHATEEIWIKTGLALCPSAFPTSGSS